MALTFRDYSADQVEAARSVLLELVHLLGEYRDDIVVVGGWVPHLILPLGPTQHVGSIDVDIALNHRNLREAGYATIQALLSRRGYEQDPRQPFIFHRTVVVNGNAIKVLTSWLVNTKERAGSIARSRCMKDAPARPEAAILHLIFSSKPRSRATCPKADGTKLASEFHRSLRSW
jgi:hypothetical protein